MNFPFGQPVHTVTQSDRSPKRAFVLGVYASAVHARWVGPEGDTIVKALAVASEPDIFWRGDGASDIVASVPIPPEVGRLGVADHRFNGPSGLALDELILHPMGLGREDAWLCDLVPHSCMNPSQKRAIERAYVPLMEQYGLPVPTVPEVPTKLADENRRSEIQEEIDESEAEVLVLLGDQPIRWFLRFYEPKWTRLSDLGQDAASYGKMSPVAISERKIQVIPLAHPRQVAKLGRSSKKWHDAHQSWLERHAATVLESVHPPWT